MELLRGSAIDLGVEFETPRAHKQADAVTHQEACQRCQSRNVGGAMAERDVLRGLPRFFHLSSVSRCGHSVSRTKGLRS